MPTAGRNSEFGPCCKANKEAWEGIWELRSAHAPLRNWSCARRSGEKGHSVFSGDAGEGDALINVSSVCELRACRVQSAVWGLDSALETLIL